tara:strand:+ start:572 stop:1189 length:618 start_codon:yes stop_codon:yes gene_type:complete
MLQWLHDLFKSPLCTPSPPPLFSFQYGRASWPVFEELEGLVCGTPLALALIVGFSLLPVIVWIGVSVYYFLHDRVIHYRSMGGACSCLGCEDAETSQEREALLASNERRIATFDSSSSAGSSSSRTMVKESDVAELVELVLLSLEHTKKTLVKLSTVCSEPLLFIYTNEYKPLFNTQLCREKDKWMSILLYQDQFSCLWKRFMQS